MELIAHQSGWDEALVLLSPVLLFVVLRMLERRRRRSRGVESTDTSAGAGDGGADSTVDRSATRADEGD